MALSQTAQKLYHTAMPSSREFPMENLQWAVIGLGIMCLCTLVLHAVFNIWDSHATKRSTSSPPMEKLKSDFDIKSELSSISSSKPQVISSKSEEDSVLAGLVLTGGVAGISWLLGACIWFASLGWAPNTERNAVMIWGLWVMVGGLAYFLFGKKDRSGREHLLGALWSLVFGLAMGTWIV